jgi:hypothetical protein
MARLAFLTFGVLRGPEGSDVVKGFETLAPTVFKSAERAHGWIGYSAKLAFVSSHLGVLWETSEHAEAYYAITLSLWQDIQSVQRFSYSGLHAKALARREKWFRRTSWPTYVMWWVEDEHSPEFGEAIERLQHLREHGPTPRAFTFKQAFDDQGAPTMTT